MNTASPARSAARAVAAEYPVVRENIDDIAVLTLNRPQARNSLSEAMLAALHRELARNVARKHAMEMLLTGDTIAAEEAYRIGLVNRVVEPGAAREQALALARKIAAKSPAAVKLGKEAFYRQIEMSVADAYEHASE